MKKEIKPTNPDEEIDKGRIALWLDPKDIEWLSTHCCCSEERDEEERDRCLRIRFRANAALHKAGLKNNKEDEGII